MNMAIAEYVRQKKIHGGFTAEEAKIICQFFGLRFEYLFNTGQTK